MSSGPRSSRRLRQFSPNPSEQVANKPAAGDAKLIAALLKWFEREARDLPWRRSGAAGKRDPYITLVSELMLQQTQVSRVLEKFEPFMQRFPSVQHLARAEETSVLEAWSGLGYYRRARLLHAAAKSVVNEHGGEMPRNAGDLLAVPGIGPYTAGAISSLAFGQTEALVDGNVTRVLLRISAKPGRLGDKETDIWAWNRARELVAQVPKEKSVGAWNEGLMELGATVCTPLGPKCGTCPLKVLCGAFAEGSVDEIPAPKVMKKRVKVYWATVVIRDPKGRILLQTRPPQGLFAGLSEAPTLETPAQTGLVEVKSFAKGVCGEEVAIHKVGSLDHQLTHRDLACDVYAATVKSTAAKGQWVTEAEAAKAALSNIQRKILQLTTAKSRTSKRRPA